MSWVRPLSVCWSCRAEIHLLHSAIHGRQRPLKLRIGVLQLQDADVHGLGAQNHLILRVAQLAHHCLIVVLDLSLFEIVELFFQRVVAGLQGIKGHPARRFRISDGKILQLCNGVELITQIILHFLKVHGINGRDALFQHQNRQVVLPEPGFQVCKGQLSYRIRGRDLRLCVLRGFPSFSGGLFRGRLAVFRLRFFGLRLRRFGSLTALSGLRRITALLGYGCCDQQGTDQGRRQQKGQDSLSHHNTPLSYFDITF